MISPLIGIEIAPADQVFGQRSIFLERPGLEGSDKLGLVDHPVLKGDQAEEQVAVGVGHGGNPRSVGRSSRLPCLRCLAPSPSTGGRIVAWTDDECQPARPDHLPARIASICLASDLCSGSAVSEW